MKLGNIEINSLVMNAACSVAKSLDDVQLLAATKIGAILVGSITVEARTGNLEPRWFTTAGYALNSFGMPNKGSTYYRQELPKMIAITHEADKKFVLSIAGFSTAEYVTLAILANEAGVDLLELNLGCPNISVEGRQKPIVSFDITTLNEIVAEVSKVTAIPLLLKLSPYSNPAELAQVARAIADSNKVAAVVASNTFPNGFMLDGREPVIASGLAGVSGRAMLPIALGQVKQFRELLPENIAVIGVGGIETSADAALYKQAGAAMVQVATLIVREGHAAIDKVIE